MRLCNALVGNHASVATKLKRLEENRFEPARLCDKLLIQINDSDKYGGDVSMLKRLTGGNPSELGVANVPKRQAGCALRIPLHWVGCPHTPVPHGPGRGRRASGWEVVTRNANEATSRRTSGPVGLRLHS